MRDWKTHSVRKSDSICPFFLSKSFSLCSIINRINGFIFSLFGTILFGCCRCSWTQSYDNICHTQTNLLLILRWGKTTNNINFIQSHFFKSHTYEFHVRLPIQWQQCRIYCKRLRAVSQKILSRMFFFLFSVFCVKKKSLVLSLVSI